MLTHGPRELPLRAVSAMLGTEPPAKAIIAAVARTIFLIDVSFMG
jgi:hypothetical protein